MIWDLTTNSVRTLFEDPDEIAIRSLAIAQNDAGILVAGNAQGSCYIWSSNNGGKTFTPQ